MMPVLSRKMIGRMLEALGLKGTNARTIDIHMDVREPVTVTVKKYLSEEQVQPALDALASVKEEIAVSIWGDCPIEHIDQPTAAQPNDDPNRVADLCIAESELLGFMLGLVRIGNLPADARLVGNHYDPQRRTLHLRLQSREFVLTMLGEAVPRFDALIEANTATEPWEPPGTSPFADLIADKLRPLTTDMPNNFIRPVRRRRQISWPVCRRAGARSGRFTSHRRAPPPCG